MSVPAFSHDFDEHPHEGDPYAIEMLGFSVVFQEVGILRRRRGHPWGSRSVGVPVHLAAVVSTYLSLFCLPLLLGILGLWFRSLGTWRPIS